MLLKTKKVIQISIVCLLAFGFIAAVYIHILETDLRQSTKEYLGEMSLQSATIIENSIQDNMMTLTSIADLLDTKEIYNNEIFTTLNTISNRNTFKRIGIIDLEGKARSSDGKDFYAGDRNYYHNALQGYNSISSLLIDRTDNRHIHVYAVPIEDKGSIIAVLFATNNVEDLADHLSTTTFQNQGYSLICDAEGNTVIPSGHDSVNNDIKNITEFTFEDDFSVDQLKTVQSSTITCSNNGTEYYLSYNHLSVNDWLVLTIVPTSVVDGQLQHFTSVAIITWGLISLICTGLVVLVYYNRRKNKEQLLTFAYKDSLTNYDNLNKCISRCQNIKNLSQYSIIDLDITDFRWFNEINGKDIGDALLCCIMEVLVESVRDDEFCARHQSDHFVLVIKSQDFTFIQEYLLTIMNTIRERFALLYTTSQYSFRAGICYFQSNQDDIIKYLEKARYTKKNSSQSSKDTIILYSGDMYKEELAEMKLLEDFGMGLKNHQFKVYLQPKVKLADESIYHVEALVRWKHPIHGLVSPSSFIPVLERKGLLEPLDMYVFNCVLQQLEKWNQQGYPVVVSINASRTYIFNKGYIENIKNMMAKYQVSPNQIEIEITETVLLNHKTQFIAIVKELKELGLRIALDDFGSDYSSLNMLKDIPIDVIKLDREFFSENIDNEKRGRIIVGELISLSKKLQITTVAEGIETRQQSEYLNSVGCDYIQGYYYYRPMPIDDFTELLHGHCTKK